MIKCNFGLVHIEGTSGIILAEFSTLVNSLKAEIPEEILREAFEQGLEGPNKCKCESCEDKKPEGTKQSESWDDIIKDLGELVAQGIQDGIESIMSERENSNKKDKDK